MSDRQFDPGKVLGEDIKELDRRQLCELASKLCARIKAEAGANGYRGGIYPENISLSSDGSVGIGAASESGWQGRELDFLAPELYWQGKPGPAADVYSVGLLLYYAAAGRLPFEGECEDAFLTRMSGRSIAAPPAAGKRLGAVIEKATAFAAEDRYSGAGELKLMLDNCLTNLYLNGVSGEQAVFNKKRGELSELELMMVNIIDADGESGGAVDGAEYDAADTAGDDAGSAGDIAEQPLEQPTEQTAEEPAGEPAAEEPREVIDVVPEEPERMETEPFWNTPFNGLFEGDGLPGDPEEMENAPAEPAGDNVFASEKLREPEVIKLTEEKNPELEPIAAKAAERTPAIKQPSPIPAVQYTKNIERERQIAAEVRKRRSRRPTAVILVLCAALVMVAIVFNAMRQDILDAQKTPAPTMELTVSPITPDAAEPAPTPDAAQAEPVPLESAEPTHDASTVSRYELFVEDVSWTEARDKCNALGGHLVVVSDEAEFNEICRLAEDKGVSRVWVGAHRIDGTMVWETTEQVSFYQWDEDEPSYSDSADGAAEDYMLLWYHRGWVYNDSRNDPAGEFPQWYSGTIGYVCEYYD